MVILTKLLVGREVAIPAPAVPTMSEAVARESKPRGSNAKRFCPI